jgi:hypothetical protein
MYICSGKDLAHSLRKACDAAKHRVWVATPYVGAWPSVRRIIRRAWWDDKAINVRLLTDPEERGLNHFTVKILVKRAKIHCLRGLYAKVYIVDDAVLLTSHCRCVGGDPNRLRLGSFYRPPLSVGKQSKK